MVGVTPFPHKDIMLVAKPLLAKEGYNLVLKDFTDYVQPNMALAGKQLFANFFSASALPGQYEQGKEPGSCIHCQGAY